MTSFESTEWINAIKPFVDDGYNVTNLGLEYGLNVTFSASSDGKSGTQCIDTVITSANMYCSSMHIDKTKLDFLDGSSLIYHYPVIVDLYIC